MKFFENHKLAFKVSLICFLCVVLVGVLSCVTITNINNQKFDAQYSQEKESYSVSYSLDDSVLVSPRITQKIYLYDQNGDVIAPLLDSATGEELVTTFSYATAYKKDENGEVTFNLSVNKVSTSSNYSLYEKTATCSNLNLTTSVEDSTFQRYDGETVTMKSAREKVVINVTRYEFSIVESLGDDLYKLTYTLLYFEDDYMYVYQTDLTISCEDADISEKLDAICVNL